MRRLLCLYFSLALILCACQTAPGEDDTSAASSPEPLSLSLISLPMTNPDTLHPLYTGKSANIEVLNLIYDSLIYLSADLSVVPQLAESCTISSDCKSIKFTLREGVAWHDGASFTARDVKYTFDLILDKSKPTVYTDRFSNVSSVTVNDDLHFTVYLDAPDSRVLNLMDFPIVPAHRTGLDAQPCGTGQYKFDHIQERKYMRLTKNTIWACGDIPIEKDIDVRILENTNDLVSSLRLGEVSAVSIDSSELSNAGYVDNAGLILYPTQHYEFLGFNFENLVLVRPSVRKAVSAAIDRAEIIKEIYFGYGTAANTPVAPHAFFYNKEADKSEYAENSCRETLLEDEWGDADGNGIFDKDIDGILYSIKATILVNEDNRSRVMCAGLISSALQEAGMDVRVETAPWEDYVKRLEDGEYTMFLAGTEFSPNLDYSFLLSGTSPHESLNYMRYSSSDMDEALLSLRMAVTSDETKAAFLNFQYVFTKDMPIAGICFLENGLLYSQRLQGVSAPGVSRLYSSINKWRFKNK